MTEIVIKTENPLTVLKGTLAVKKHQIVYFNSKGEWLFRKNGDFQIEKSLDEVMCSNATTVEELLAGAEAKKEKKQNNKKEEEQ